MRIVRANPSLAARLIFAALGAAAFGATFFCFQSTARGAGLLVADGGLGGQLSIQSHDVHVVVNNGIAVTTVDQVFKNMEPRVVEALYTFPVPKGASVSNFSMWINGKEMTGEVVEKKRAREIYNSYKRVNKDPGLLEQVDYRTFEMRIFPIAANAEQHVQVTYCQELDFDHDRATYVYPLATTTRGNADTKVEGKFAISVDAKSEIPITDLASPSHAKEFVVAKHSANYQQASLEARGGSLARDVVLSFGTSRPRTGLDLIASKTGSEDGYFSLTLAPGEELKATNKPMDYVFVLDVSGSMNEAGKLETSQHALSEFVTALGPDDRFEVMSFNVQASTCFGQLASADDASKAKAQAFLDGQRAAGGTVLKNAMSTAYKYADATRPLNVILLSDGLTEQGERQTLLNLIGQRPKASRVFSIGVGNDVNRPLLEQMANDSGGLAAFVSRDDDLKRQAQAFRRKLLRPIATDVAIQISGADVYDVVPAKLPNLYYGAPVRVYGRYKKSGPAKVNVTGTAEGHALEQSVDMDFPTSDDANPQVERMWAWRRVDALLKQADAQGDRNTVADEVVRLGEGYSIVTEFTSFLVLENDGEYQRWKIDRKNALRTSRDRTAMAKVSGELEKLRDAAAADLGPAGVEAKPALAATPAMATPTQFAAVPATPNAPAAPQPQTGRNRDIGFSGGGGAFEPVGAIAVIVIAAGVRLILRRRREFGVAN